MTEPKFRLDNKKGASVSLDRKELRIGVEEGVPMLWLTNEYGNSLSYAMVSAQFETLHAKLWSFVKESQH